MSNNYTENDWFTISCYNILPIYEVNPYGDIRYITSKERIKEWVCSSTGYKMVALDTNRNGSVKKYIFLVHRIVAMTFVPGHSDETNIVDHINCNKQDNFYLNLEWVTMRENNIRARKNNLIHNAKGEDVGTNVLSEDMVRLICGLLVKHDGRVSKVLRELTLMGMNINTHLVYQIKSKKTWSWISDEFFSLNEFNDIQEAEIVMICEELIRCDGKINLVLYKLKDRIPHLNYSMIKDIKHKVHWSNISDKFFDDKFFEKQYEISESDAHLICKTLVECEGVGSIVYKKLKDIIPGLTYARVQNIKYKRSWKSISDLYF